ncbi:MAG: hypothetical protein EXS15_02955 [Phycisphaerales bacterium]|nr:hypothetical protein [Phycisphaerales bacterium]
MANFFEHQERAQSRTLWLVVLFLFGVCGVTACVTTLMALFIPNSVWLAILLSLLLIGIPFLYKLLTMSASGVAVAESLGGTRIDPASSEVNERKILNVVEEMAIASGMPIPPVFVLDEECINAFAAGTTPQDAVIGVSRGALETLTRDELQGVMAHEFSHIFHGDMRINMRAIAAIFGIMAVGYVGYFLLRSTMYAPRGRKSDGRATAGIALFGLGLIVVGCVGTFFGRLMQAAISRQREFLADASAVQYTRNPSGIGGALRKILGQSSAAMHHAEASQFNHMLFCEGVQTLFASHPPLAERIARIESIAGVSLPEPSTPPIPRAPVHSNTGLASSFAAVGSVRPSGLASASVALSAGGDQLNNAAHQFIGAKAIVWAITLSTNPTRAAAQRSLVAQRSSDIADALREVEVAVASLNTQSRLALVDVACATLVNDHVSSYQVFRRLLSDSVRLDGTVDLLEWTVLQVLRMRVELPIAVRGGAKLPARTATLAQHDTHARRILGLFALQGTHDEECARLAFERALKVAGLEGGSLPPQEERSLDSIAKGLDALESLRPTAAGRLVEAALCCVRADAATTDREYLLLRALSERLAIPLPPMID